ncbi:MAG: hypothetical protein ACE5EX_04970, partial [Phycisphaerae bacterium]
MMSKKRSSLALVLVCVTGIFAATSRAWADDPKPQDTLNSAADANAAADAAAVATLLEDILNGVQTIVQNIVDGATTAANDA